MKAIKLLFLVMAICLASGVNAQFNSSDNGYCYQYVKTVNDGISSKEEAYYHFVIFQNDMMEYAIESRINEIRKEILENPNHYFDRARKDLAKNYNNWINNTGKFSGVKLYRFCPELSTPSTYTYRWSSAHAIEKGLIGMNYGDLSYSFRWSELSWGEACYSFSIDKKELIRWSISKPELRHYYKLIDINDFKPNIDFIK